jgi:hypothetical protein
VKLVGITSFLMDGHWSIPSSIHSSNGEVGLFLVVERASEGNLLDFVERKLKGASQAESWDFVLDTLCSIAVGVSNLHDHGIIHRYT